MQSEDGLQIRMRCGQIRPEAVRLLEFGLSSGIQGSALILEPLLDGLIICRRSLARVPEVYLREVCCNPQVWIGGRRNIYAAQDGQEPRARLDVHWHMRSHARVHRTSTADAVILPCYQKPPDRHKVAYESPIFHTSLKPDISLIFDDGCICLFNAPHVPLKQTPIRPELLCNLHHLLLTLHKN
jgi:hypothetical protein